jgi:tetratricopeptide (TPR) repeat protein
MRKEFLLLLVFGLLSTEIMADTLEGSIGSNQVLFNSAMELKRNAKHLEAEEMFVRIIKAEPNNLAVIEQLAIVQSWQKKFDFSIDNFNKVLSIDEHFTGARIGLARVLYWKGEYEFALSEIQQVINDQSNVSDHWILKGDILMADDKPIDARKSYLQAKRILGTQIDSSLESKINHAQPIRKWRLDAGYISDSYSADRVDGHSSYMQVGYNPADKITVYLRGEEYFSFDRTDTGVVFGTYFMPHESILVNGEYYANNNQVNFRPSKQISLNTDFIFNNVWQPLLNIRQAIYSINDGSNGDVTTITPGLRYINGNATFEFRHARSTNTNDTTTITNSLKLNMTYDSFTPYIFYTNGEEGIPPLAVAEISIIGAGAVFQLNNNMGLRIDLSREDRKNSYIYNALGAGISVYF